MSKSLKVLHFYKTSLASTQGGVEVFIDTLCQYTAKHNIEHSVLSLSELPSINPISMNGYTVYQAKQDLYLTSTGFSLSAFKKFKDLAQKADIIHYHHPNPFADLLHLLCNINKPSILTYHSDIIKQKRLAHIYYPLQQWFLNKVDRIIATSPNYVTSSNTLQKHLYKTSIIPIGISLNDYPTPTPESIDYWRQKLKPPFFLFIGAMRYYKGLHIALDAIKQTGLRFVIAGAGGIEDELKQYASDNKISNAVFLGQISEQDKAALLHLCHGFVFPSHLRSEAFGISLLEAAFFGKPLISCEIGSGTSYVNKDSVTGLVVTPSSPDALRHAMQFLMDNPAKALEMGKNAKARAQDLFTAEKQTESYMSLYKKIIKNNTTCVDN